MSPIIQQLLDALIALAIEELSRKFPHLPVAQLAPFARDIIVLSITLVTDPVQREAELRAIYAKLAEQPVMQHLVQTEKHDKA